MVVDMSMTGTIHYNKFPGAASKTRTFIGREVSLTADLIVKKAQQRAKKNTGFMAKETRVLKRGPMSATVGAMAYYSGFLDQGTRYIRADRWFSGAVDMERGPYTARITQVVNEAWAL
jgi:hypothetical protein